VFFQIDVHGLSADKYSSFLKGYDMKLFAAAVLAILFAGLGCSISPRTQEQSTILDAEVQEAMAVFKARDPGIETFFKKSYGYAVLPRIFKVGLVGGGGYGRGIVYEQGRRVGYADTAQATIGFTIGGEYFREIIFFRDKVDLDRFKADEFTFAAQVTAVAASAGAAAKADYRFGTAVFIMQDAGLMADVSIGGQKFRYVPLLR
jgi:lipid-binding SYLF domain-containing protein